MTKQRSILAILLFIGLTGALGGAVRADDAFTATNPSTGQTESVWAATVLGGSSTEIFFSTLQGTGWSPSQQITINAMPDANPNLAFSPGGDRRIAWWNDGPVDAVYVSFRAASEDGWSAPSLVSDGIEDARSPRVSIFGGSTHVVYEGVPATGPRRIYVSKQDSPTPITRSLLAVASQASPLAARIHNESGHLWVDWVNSSNLLGWSEYVRGAWASVLYEPYDGSSDIDEGRARIRSGVLGQ